MKKYIILYYANEEDINASQLEVEALDMKNAITQFYETFAYLKEPFMCYPLGLRAMFQPNFIPPAYQKDIPNE